MKKYLKLSCFALLLVGCSGSNGSDVPTQEELQKDLKTIMEPRVPKNVVVNPDTTLKDSISTDSLIQSQ
jgi:uncharacterized protein YcfL